MEVFEDGPVAEAREKYPDILLAQLLDSSAAFREWFVDRATAAHGIDTYHGVRCNETMYGRETDLLFGFEGTDNGDHLVLVENKIQAQEQPQQFADYHERGISYVERGVCDRYSVCLLAPDEWAPSDVTDDVDRVLPYEAVMDRLEPMDHDGAEFTQAVFSQAVTKASASVPDHSDVTADLWRRVTEASSHELQQSSVTGKHVRCTAAHPAHPDFVIYNIYLARFGEHGHTNLRLQINFGENTWLETIDVDRDRLKDRFGDAIDQLLTKRQPEFREGYENIGTQSTTVISNRLQHADLPSIDSEEYYQAVVDEFCRVVELTHPVVRDIDFRAKAQKLG